MDEYTVELHKNYYGEVTVKANSKHEAELRAIEVWNAGDVEWDEPEIVVISIEKN